MRLIIKLEPSIYYLKNYIFAVLICLPLHANYKIFDTSEVIPFVFLGYTRQYHIIL
jgi:hypothetical protein